MLLFLTLTVAAALLGGLYPALASAAVGSLLLNWFFTPPVHTLTIADPENIVAIAIFVGVAVSVASVVDLAARRTHQAARLRAESEILSVLAGSVLRGENSLEALLERVRETFGMESVALLERASDVDPWTCAGSVGTRTAVARPEEADVDMPVSDRMRRQEGRDAWRGDGCCAIPVTGVVQAQAEDGCGCRSGALVADADPEAERRD